jgi:hypothetical protein
MLESFLTHVYRKTTERNYPYQLVAEIKSKCQVHNQLKLNEEFLLLKTTILDEKQLCLYGQILRSVLLSFLIKQMLNSHKIDVSSDDKISVN